MKHLLTTVLLLTATSAHATFNGLNDTRVQLKNQFTVLANDGWGSGWNDSHTVDAIAHTAQTIEQFNDGYKIAYVDNYNRIQYRTEGEVEESVEGLVGAIELDLFGNLEEGRLNEGITGRTGIIGAQVSELVDTVVGINRYVTCNGLTEYCTGKFQTEINKFVQPRIDAIHGTIDTIVPIIDDLKITQDGSANYASPFWHVDGVTQGNLTKTEIADESYRIQFGNSQIYGLAGFSAWARDEPVSFFYPDSSDHVDTWRRSDWEAVPSTNPAYADIIRLQPRAGTRISIEKWNNGQYAVYRLDYDLGGTEISKRQLGGATTNFATQHTKVENDYIDRVVPTWDRWDADAWTHVSGTDAYEYGQGAGTGRIVWNDDLQAFRGTYTTSGGSVINITDSTDKEEVLNDVRDHVDTWG